MTPQEVLVKYFGYEKFRGDQERIINSILAGENVLALMPTGGGKSLCYQIPAILSNSFAIVVSPLIALMKDQVDAANKKIPFAGFINSSIEYFEQERILSAFFEKRLKLLYVSPEKLEAVQFAERIKELAPEYLFVDEAHCISEWGHNFRPSYRKITTFAQYTGITKIAAFTATATQYVKEDIIKQLELINPVVYSSGFLRDNLSIEVIRTSKKKEAALDILKKNSAPAIIYSATRKFAEEFHDFLRINNYNGTIYHAGLPDEMRKMIQEDFLNGKVDYIVATNAFGMGIDKSNIRTVLHLHMPGSIESYYQEIGRAGRDGKPSNVVLLFDERDINIQKYFIDNSNPDYEQIQIVYNTVCNYYKISVGSEYQKNLDLNPEITKLLEVRGINKARLESALKILSRLEYFIPASGSTTKTTFRFLPDNNELKRFVKKIASRELKSLIVHLLRKYGSDTFIRHVSLHLENDAEVTGFTVGKIRELLENLSNTGIIELRKPALGEVFRLNGTRINTNALYIDTAIEDEMKKRMQLKLDGMVAFCYTRECRMNFILNYFGDKGNDDCGICDNCSRDEVKDSSQEYIQDKVLHLLNEARISIKFSDLVSHLKSGKSRRKINAGYTASCSHFTKEEIESALNNLAVKGFIKIYSEIVVLAERGKNYLTVEVESESIEVVQQTDYEDKLEFFNQLKELRKVVSKRFGQPERMIISDEILSRISRAEPSTRTELLAIEGFSNRMFNKLGDDILDLVKERAEKKAKENKDLSKELPDNLIATCDLLRKETSIEDMAKILSLPETIISLQVETILQYKKGTKVEYLFNEGELDSIKLEISKGRNNLKKLKEALPDIPFSTIRIGVAYLSN